MRRRVTLLGRTVPGGDVRGAFNGISVGNRLPLGPPRGTVSGVTAIDESLIKHKRCKGHGAQVISVNGTPS